jgi:hypothetical protein
VGPVVATFAATAHDSPSGARPADGARTIQGMKEIEVVAVFGITTDDAVDRVRQLIPGDLEVRVDGNLVRVRSWYSEELEGLRSAP